MIRLVVEYREGMGRVDPVSIRPAWNNFSAMSCSRQQDPVDGLHRMRYPSEWAGYEFVIGVLSFAGFLNK